MIYIQDNIEYKIEDDIVKGWKGTSPFKKPFWNGSAIIEGWTQEDQDYEDAVKDKEDKDKLLKDEYTVIWEGLTPSGYEYFVGINDAGKLEAVELNDIILNK